MVATPLFFKKEIIFGPPPLRDPGCDTGDWSCIRTNKYS